MLVRGFVFSGVMRGQPLIDIYYDRLSGLIGFKPFRGTLDIKLEQSVDIKKFSTKAVEHNLLDGTKKVNLRLAPVNLYVGDKKYACWCMQQEEGIYERDIVELISKDRLKDAMQLEDRQQVEIEFFELPDNKAPGFLDKFKTEIIKNRQKVVHKNSSKSGI